MDNVLPITPKELDEKPKVFPVEVIESFNELIERNYSNGKAVVLQKEVVSKIADKMGLIRHNKIYNNHWLDVEELYRNAGWKVEYDKPGFNEVYEANFTFKRI